jgi:hypothetical protein
MDLSTSNADAKLLDMINRHDKLWDEWDRLNEQNERDPRIDSLSDECCALELLIIATPAHTKAGRDGKLHIIAKVGFIGDEAGNPPTGDLAELVGAILDLDAARITASR